MKVGNARLLARRWAPWVAAVGLFLALGTGDSLPLAALGVGLLMVVAWVNQGEV